MADNNKTDNSILADIQALENESGEKIIKDKPVLTPEQSAELDQEIELEKKYGDKGLRTFGESVASGATFGLSDQALVHSGISSKEELRERRKRNSGAAIAGEITGIAGSALLSGGESLLAKGLGAGVKGAGKAGILTTKALTRLMADTGKKELAKSVLKKSIASGAGSAVEGSFYGLGKLISEEALGKADFNAENFISHVGSAALFGGALGAGGSFIHTAVPVIKGNKITGWVTKKIKGSLDPARNAQELAGVTPSQIYKMKSNPWSKPLYEHTPEMLKEVATKKGLTAFSSNTTLFNSVKGFIDDTGKAIGKSLDDVQEVLAVKGALPKKSEVAQRIITKLDDLSLKFKDADGKVLATARDKVRKIEKIRTMFDKDLISNKIMSTKNINELKQKYQKLAKWDYRLGKLPLDEEINREISRALREEVNHLAEKAGGELGATLKRNNLNYGSATEFISNFGKNIDAQSIDKYMGMKDILLGGMFGKSGLVISAAQRFAKSDLKKRLVILTDIEKANIKVDNRISSGIGNFLKGNVNKTIKPLGVRALLDSTFSYKREEGKSPKKPKNQKEAFKNMRENLQNLQNPEKLYESMNLGNLEEAAPLAAAHSQVVLSSAVQFLFEKMPKEASPRGMFTKHEYQPSSIEIAKFNKYIQAIENPMSVMDDLEHGLVTRESVEALQAVYPNLYQRIQQTTFDKIVKSDKSIDYKKRLNLGILLDVPTDTALNPETIFQLQQHFSEAQQSQSGGAISAGRASKLDMAQSQATEVQKVSNRKDLK